MKKYFIFAAVAAVGLFASCSSDDSLSQSPNVNEGPDGRPAISIGIGSPAGLDTRGTGTVGGVGTTAANAWHGQIINVFMFTKDANKATTLNLTPGEGSNTSMYDNLAMYTPGTDKNLIDTPSAMSTPAASGEAMITDGTINYYPTQGNFDFFGYHGDDAVDANAEITKTDDLWTVPFEIDGSQDLMSTKAALLDGQAAMVGADFYSAKAARKGVQPTLTFKHLLTRLSFSVVAGNDKAAGTTVGTDTKTKTEFDALNAADQVGYEAATYAKIIATHITKDAFDALDAADQASFTPTNPNDLTVGYDLNTADEITAADYDAFSATIKAYYEVATYEKDMTVVDASKAIQIKSIKVKSKATGNLAVAWTGDKVDADKITWSANPAVSMTLKERAAYKRLAAAAAADGADLYDDYGTMSAEERTAADAEALALETELISAATYNKFTVTGKAKYEDSPNAENERLIALTPTAPAIDVTKTVAADRYPATAIGEALIVAPSTEDYEMEVEFAQKVNTNWNSTNNTDVKEMTQTLTIPVPQNQGIGGASAGFLMNTSYNVKLTVYGFERIVVNAVVEPWTEGEDIPVGADE